MALRPAFTWGIMLTPGTMCAKLGTLQEIETISRKFQEKLRPFLLQKILFSNVQGGKSLWSITEHYAM